MQRALAGSRTTGLPALQQPQQQQQHACSRHAAFVPGSRRAVSRRRLQRCRAEAEGERAAASTQTEGEVNVKLDIDKEVSKFARNAAVNFAPRPSGATGKNPAYKGSVLYTVFEVQAWLALVVGGLLSFNLIFPSDKPDIASLLGMWSVWMWTVPSLRARDCEQDEKDALNLLFIAIPLLNVIMPFIYKEPAFIFTADCVMMAGVYAWKGLIPALATEEQKSS